MLVPQGNLRLLACGADDTTASKDEIEDQVRLLREAMDQGAVGMSRQVSRHYHRNFGYANLL
jgi:N-acyl-D-aspartate/D-glutamate deacylase